MKKKKIIVTTILLGVSVLLIAISIYATTSNKTQDIEPTNENVTEENIEENDLLEESENIIEKETVSINAENAIVDENQVKEEFEEKPTIIQPIQEKTEQKKSSTTSISSNSKSNSTITKNDTNNIQTKTTSQSNQSSPKIDLSKYNYYEKAPDESYKGFIEDKAEMNKLKNLIDSSISNFGYKNVKIVEDSSLAKSGVRYFTANKTNVDNLVYDSDGFGIYYYAVKEYIISKDGTESYFQTRSYIKVK